MAPPSLLTIPRELRDLIYGYLHHSIQPKWEFDVLGNQRAEHLGIEHAPIVDVLLINRQIYHEYWEASLKLLCAVVDWDIDQQWNKRQTWELFDNDELTVQLSANLICQVRNFSILRTFDCSYDTYMISHEDTWQIVDKCAATLRSKYPQLATIQVVLRYMLHSICEKTLMNLKYPYLELVNQRELRSETRAEVVNAVDSKLIQYPSTVAYLPLAFYGHGHYVSTGLDEDWVSSLSPEDPVSSMEIHDLNKVVAYVYALRMPNHLLYAPDLWLYWNYPKLSDKTIGDLDEECIGRIREREYKMLDWSRQCL